jgi:hypothetical protein
MSGATRKPQVGRRCWYCAASFAGTAIKTGRTGYHQLCSEECERECAEWFDELQHRGDIPTQEIR